MSSRLVDSIVAQHTPDRPNVVTGRCANTVTNPSDDLYVTIGAFDGHRVQWGPCDWVPANALPTRGDDVVVVFDENLKPWVIAFTFGSRTVLGTVAAPAPTVTTDPLYVNVDALTVGPMPWTPRNVIAQVGDSALVQFDEDGNPWALLTTLPPATSPLIVHTNYTADVAFTATTDGTAQLVVQTPSVNFTGKPVYLQFFCPRFDSNASALQTYYIALYMDGFAAANLVVSRWCSVVMSNTSFLTELMLGYQHTPPAGSHFYAARAWSTSSNGGNCRGGPGGQNNMAPGYLRITADG